MKELNLNREMIGEYDIELKLSEFLDVEILDISETPISDISFFEDIQLDNLKEIDISSTNIQDIGPLKYLKNLKILRANQLNLNNLDSLSQLSSLEELYLEYSNVSDLTPIKNLKNLTALDLMGNDKIIDLSPISQLNNLQKLYIQGTGVNSKEKFSAISHMKFDRILVNEVLVPFSSMCLRVPEDKKISYEVSANTNIGLFSPLNEKQSLIPQEFIEMFKGALEVLDLSDISEEEKRIILHFLNDERYTPEEIVLFSKELLLPDSIINSIDIIYCALHPDKWETTPFAAHKKNLLDNTAKFSLPVTATPQELSKRIEQFKKLAKITVSKIFEENITLTSQEESIKFKIVQNAKEKFTAKTSNITSFPDSQKTPKKGIIDEYLDSYCSEYSSYSDESESDSLESPRENKSEIKVVELKLQGMKKNVSSLSGDKWKQLICFSDVWNDIYTLVKFSGKYNRQRDEKQMFKVVKAILYHEEKKCSWGNQSFVPGGQAYYYKRLWEKEGKLEKIFTLANTLDLDKGSYNIVSNK